MPKGKTVNARRYAPVHEGTRAAEVLVRRLSATRSHRTSVGLDGEHPSDTDFLFTDLLARTTTDRPATVISKEMGRVRRKVLGRETDKRLNFHSTRHTWRTKARRAGLDPDTVSDLGGWAGRAGTDRAVYDHGLARQQLREESWKVIERMREEKYWSEAS